MLPPCLVLCNTMEGLHILLAPRRLFVSFRCDTSHTGWSASAAYPASNRLSPPRGKCGIDSLAQVLQAARRACLSVSVNTQHATLAERPEGFSLEPAALPLCPRYVQQQYENGVSSALVHVTQPSNSHHSSCIRLRLFHKCIPSASTGVNITIWLTYDTAYSDVVAAAR